MSTIPEQGPYIAHPDAPDYPNEHCIVCPYCLYEDHEPGEHSGLRHDGDTTHFECPECDQVSRVTLSVTYEYLAEPIDPEIPRKPFLVNVTCEGEASVKEYVYPESIAINLFIQTWTSLGRDPFASSGIYQLELIGDDGKPLKKGTSLVNQGVRPDHQLLIRRKVPVP